MSMIMVDNPREGMQIEAFASLLKIKKGKNSATSFYLCSTCLLISDPPTHPPHPHRSDFK